LTVSAAASLTNAFRELARVHEAHHPDTRVLLNFGGSGALLQQIANGAPVDVFVSADRETMDRAVAERLVGPARDFVANSLVLAVPADGGLTVTSLQQLAQTRLARIAIGNPATVPAGRYAMRALTVAGLHEGMTERLIHTQHVRQALDYLARGEVDAAFVYSSDLLAMPGRVRLAFELPLDPPVRYPVAPVRDSAQPAEAARFIDFLFSDECQAILRRHGFRSP